MGEGDRKTMRQPRKPLISLQLREKNDYRFWYWRFVFLQSAHILDGQTATKLINFIEFR